MKIFLETEAEAGGLLVKGPALATWKADPITKHKKYTRKWLVSCLLFTFFRSSTISAVFFRPSCCQPPLHLFCISDPLFPSFRPLLPHSLLPHSLFLKEHGHKMTAQPPSWILLSNRGSAVFPRPGGAIRVSALNMIKPAHAVVWNCAWGWV